MKLHADRLDGTNAISRHSTEGVVVNGVEYRHSVVVAWNGEVRPWPPRSTDEVTASHFEALAAFEPELVLFGSGPRLQFVNPALQRALHERRIGIETMDTAAACRTYNILIAEGRSVLAALIF